MLHVPVEELRVMMFHGRVQTAGVSVEKIKEALWLLKMYVLNEPKVSRFWSESNNV